jgi:hypothetical protein
MTVRGIAIGFIPIWIYIGFRLLTQPVGTLELVALAGFQFILLIFLIIYLFAIWSVIEVEKEDVPKEINGN